MSNYLQRLLICLTFMVLCMNLAVKAMNEEEINAQLSTVKKCNHPGAQRIYCELVNAYGGQQFLCSEHDESRINQLNDRLTKIRQTEAEEEAA